MVRLNFVGEQKIEESETTPLYLVQFVFQKPFIQIFMETTYLQRLLLESECAKTCIFRIRFFLIGLKCRFKFTSCVDI